MSSIVLFIFEGEKTEVNITDSLSRHFVNEPDKTLIKASYRHNVYQLHKEMADDNGLDITGLIIEALEERALRGDKLSESERELLAIADPDLISDVYLFFDYDEHCSNASDDKLMAQLAHFDSAQENGLLCVSYPMAEAIKQIKPTQNQPEQTAELLPLAQFNGYKKWLNAQIKQGVFSARYQNWGEYSAEVWREIIDITLQRANLLVNNRFALAFEPFAPSSIFDQQQTKYLPYQEIAVLSAFPLMLLDYYGRELQNKIA